MNKKLINLYAISILLSGCSIVTTHTDQIEGYSVNSWHTESFVEYNQTLLEAKKIKEDWVYTPSLWGAHLLNVFELKKFSYHYIADTIENNTSGKIVIIRDGFLDDSIRGDIHEINIKKIDSNWEIKSVKKAFRCWRSSSLSYGTEACP